MEKYNVMERPDCVRVIREWIRRYGIQPDELFPAPYVAESDLQRISPTTDELLGIKEQLRGG